MSESPIMVQRDNLDIPNPSPAGRNTYADTPQRGMRLSTSAQLALVLGGLLFFGILAWGLVDWLRDIWQSTPALRTLAVGALAVLGLALMLGTVLAIAGLVLKLFLVRMPGEQPALIWQLMAINMAQAVDTWRSVQAIDAGNTGRVMTTKNETLHYGAGARVAPPEAQPSPAPQPATLGTGKGGFLAALAAGESARSGLNLFVGYDSAGVAQHVDFRKTYAMALAGAPGVGKSTTARILATQFAMLPDPAGLVIVDPHGEAHPDSLAVNLGGLTKAMIVPPAIGRSDMTRALEQLRNACAARLSEARAEWAPLVLFVDEFTSIALERSAWSNTIVKTIFDMCLQYRKVGFRAVLIGQAWSANVLPVDFRDQIGGCIIHAIAPHQATFLLPNKDEAKLAETLAPQSGEALFKPHFAMPVQRIIVPYLSRGDIESPAMQGRIRPAPVVHLAAAPSAKQATIEGYRAQAEQAPKRVDRLRIAYAMAYKGFSAQDIAYGAKINDADAGRIAKSVAARVASVNGTGAP